jgi:RNA polymerase sigma-70 factor (ECF subfamily)
MTEELNERIDVIEEVDDFEYTNYKASMIMEAIDLLPDGCKTVLSLYLFEGYDHKEISQILSISESASKAQFCKAKARIRNQLENRNMQQYV